MQAGVRFPFLCSDCPFHKCKYSANSRIFGLRCFVLPILEKVRYNKYKPDIKSKGNRAESWDKNMKKRQTTAVVFVLAISLAAGCGSVGSYVDVVRNQMADAANGAKNLFTDLFGGNETAVTAVTQPVSENAADDTKEQKEENVEEEKTEKTLTAKMLEAVPELYRESLLGNRQLSQKQEELLQKILEQRDYGADTVCLFFEDSYESGGEQFFVLLGRAHQEAGADAEVLGDLWFSDGNDVILAAENLKQVSTETFTNGDYTYLLLTEEEDKNHIYGVKDGRFCEYLSAFDRKDVEKDRITAYGTPGLYYYQPFTGEEKKDTSATVPYFYQLSLDGGIETGDGGQISLEEFLKFDGAEEILTRYYPGWEEAAPGGLELTVLSLGENRYAINGAEYKDAGVFYSYVLLEKGAESTSDSQTEAALADSENGAEKETEQSGGMAETKDAVSANVSESNAAVSGNKTESVRVVSENDTEKESKVSGNETEKESEVSGNEIRNGNEVSGNETESGVSNNRAGEREVSGNTGDDTAEISGNDMEAQNQISGNTRIDAPAVSDEEEQEEKQQEDYREAEGFRVLSAGQGQYLEDYEETVEKLPVQYQDLQIKNRENMLTVREREALLAILETEDYPEEAICQLWQADYDRDGTRETFAALGEYDSKLGKPLCDIWFVKEDSAEKLMKRQPFLSAAMLENQYGRALNIQLLTEEGKTFSMYGVQDGKAVAYVTSASRIQVEENEDVTVWKKPDRSAGEEENGSTTEAVVKPYYYHFTQSGLEEYAAEEMAEAAFLSYRNGKLILEGIKDRYAPVQLQYLQRENGMLHVNITVRDVEKETLFFETYLIRDGYLVPVENGQGHYEITPVREEE